jgi:hypothetical protein
LQIKDDLRHHQLQSSPWHGSGRIRAAGDDMLAYDLWQQGRNSAINVSLAAMVLLAGMREL